MSREAPDGDLDAFRSDQDAAAAARIFGRVTAAVTTVGRKPRRRIADLLIAATAIAEGLPLFTTNPGDFAGLDTLLAVIPVTRPDIPHERQRDD